MDTYLELNVPIRRNTKWYRALKCVMRNIVKPNEWKKDFHITVAFIYNDDHVVELKEAFEKIINASKPISLTLDKLDVFETKIRKNFVIYLDSSKPSEELLALINDLRSAAKRVGANMEDFRLHITLAEIENPTMPMEQVQNAISSIVHKPSFTIPIIQAKYRYVKGRTIGEWHLKNN